MGCEGLLRMGSSWAPGQKEQRKEKKEGGCRGPASLEGWRSGLCLQHCPQLTPQQWAPRSLEQSSGSCSLAWEPSTWPSLWGRSSQDKTWEGEEEIEKEERGGSSFPPTGPTINQPDRMCNQIQCP